MLMIWINEDNGIEVIFNLQLKHDNSYASEMRSIDI